MINYNLSNTQEQTDQRELQEFSYPLDALAIYGENATDMYAHQQDNTFNQVNNVGIYKKDGRVYAFSPTNEMQELLRRNGLSKDESMSVPNIHLKDALPNSDRYQEWMNIYQSRMDKEAVRVEQNQASEETINIQDNGISEEEREKRSQDDAKQIEEVRKNLGI
jgi:hypothetical protein